MNADSLVLGVLWYAVFLFSTTCHEAAHALAAKLGGDRTAFYGGQVTIDPVPHIRREPFGMVLVPVLSYLFGRWMMGWADRKSTRLNSSHITISYAVFCLK